MLLKKVPGISQWDKVFHVFWQTFSITVLVQDTWYLYNWDYQQLYQQKSQIIQIVVKLFPSVSRLKKTLIWTISWK